LEQQHEAVDAGMEGAVVLQGMARRALPHSVLEVAGRRRQRRFPGSTRRPAIGREDQARRGGVARGAAPKLPAAVAPGEEAVFASVAPLLRPCKSGRLRLARGLARCNTTIVKEQ
jgi:hypothetical protein